VEHKILKDVETFSKEKYVHVLLFNSDRMKVLLLCLSGGLTVPPHSHPGFYVTLQPLKGQAILPVEGGKEITLIPGEVFFMDGAVSFSPRNTSAEDFEMLIHLVRR